MCTHVCMLEEFISCQFSENAMKAHQCSFQTAECAIPIPLSEIVHLPQLLRVAAQISRGRQQLEEHLVSCQVRMLGSQSWKRFKQFAV